MFRRTYHQNGNLFLTSKVRLHCDGSGGCGRLVELLLFLTSKVRLHCDSRSHIPINELRTPFPDLKGQAPLRLARRVRRGQIRVVLFLTSKVRLHCDVYPVDVFTGVLARLFLTSKVRLHCDRFANGVVAQQVSAFSGPQRSGSIATRPSGSVTSSGSPFS